MHILEPLEILHWRQRLALTKEQMAKYLGTSPNTYAKWENGTRYPSRSAAYLFRVLQQAESACPALHKQLLPKGANDAATPKKRMGLQTM
jgi:transcriptional regulator with XRE-family HTH domain